MKLKDILEANMYPVDHYEPSGAGSAVSVDPDKVDKMLDPEGTRYSRMKERDQADRSKRIRKHWKVAKGTRSEPKQTGKVVSDSTDMTGSGPNSAVNGPFNY